MPGLSGPERGRCPRTPARSGHPGPPPSADPIEESVPLLQPKHHLSAPKHESLDQGIVPRTGGVPETGDSRLGRIRLQREWGEGQRKSCGARPLRGRWVGARRAQLLCREITRPAPPETCAEISVATRSVKAAAHAAAISQSPSSKARIASRYQEGIWRARRSARSTRTSVCFAVTISTSSSTR